MELKLQPALFKCKSSDDGFAILSPVRINVNESEDYVKTYVIVWRCNKAATCKSTSCHYAGRGVRKQ